MHMQARCSKQHATVPQQNWMRPFVTSMYTTHHQMATEQAVAATLPVAVLMRMPMWRAPAMPRLKVVVHKFKEHHAQEPCQ